MGYSLEIHKVETTPTYIGAKLYGYTSHIGELESVKWLLKHGYIKSIDDFDIAFYCETASDIVMSIERFKEFAPLYNKDMNNYYPSKYCKHYKKDMFINDEYIQQLLASNDDDYIVFRWC